MKYFLVVLGSILSQSISAQNIFSQSEMGYKKSFAPYSIDNVIGLEDQEMILLTERGKGKFRLVRYDKYFFDKWSVVVDYKKEGSFPKLFKVGNEAVIFRFWTTKTEGFAEIQSYDVNTGEQKSHIRKTLIKDNPSVVNANIRVAADLTNFVVYDFNSGDGIQELIQVFDLTTLELKRSVGIDGSKTAHKTKAVHVDHDNNIFVALSDPGSFTLNTYFFNEKDTEPVILSSAFSFNRPAGSIPSVHILKQSESSYLIVTPAYIGTELIGMNVSSLNVILKTLLYSHTHNFDREFIKNSYANAHFTSENQRKKYITTPANLEGFKIRDIIPDSEGGITCIFENLDVDHVYLRSAPSVKMPLKWKIPEDVHYFGEDVLFVSLSYNGDISWRKVIQKTQFSKDYSLTLSYVSQTFGDDIKLVMQESAKGNSIYVYTMDLLNGGVSDVKSFFDKKVVVNTNYCGWIDEKTLLICAYPDGSKKRTLYLVEF